MKTLRNIIAIAVILLVIVSCKNETKPEVETIEVKTATEATDNKLDLNATYAKAEFKIEGMTCAIGCAKTIQKKMAKMDGVKSAVVDFDRQLAMVEYDEAKVTPTSLEEAVKKAGDDYTVKEMRTVESFSAKKGCSSDCKKACCANKEKKSCSVKCSPDCTEKDCAKCAAKTAECKKKCDAKKAEAHADIKGDKKMACAKGKKSCSVKCSPDCTEKDCAKCAAKTAECKKKCDAKKAEANSDMKGDMKMACAKDCEKACCANKAKA